MNRRLCKKCNKQIPFRLVKPDGSIKLRSGTRVHCYDCLPHGSKKLTTRPKYKCICQRCNKEFLYLSRTGCTTIKCRSCVTTIARIKKKQRAVNYLGGCCQHCGYNKSSRALHFHHKNPADKTCNISAYLDKSWTRIQNELDKCDLLCANCHAEQEDKVASGV